MGGNLFPYPIINIILIIIMIILFKAVSIADEDIKRQEDRVAIARKKLQDALRNLQT